MDKRYELYCLSDPVFYDAPTGPSAFSQSSRTAPAAWERSERDDWVIYRPIAAVLPDQGWKIHVSSTLDEAEEVLEQVWLYCFEHELPFKFLRARHLLHLRNAKYADRGASGKLAAIYPRDEAQLERVTEELGTLLAGRRGPYILSDLRIGEGPLYVRYGGIAERHCLTPEGRIEPAIAAPDGTLVPDRRGPVFAPPPWVHLPHFLEPHLIARRATTFDGVPYSIDKVLHFSNGGGVYQGKDRRTGRDVVLKEARPHAGLDFAGHDAVARLSRERDALSSLAGLGAVPELIDEFTVGDHRFMVMEHIDGRPLNQVFGDRYPLAGQAGGDRAAYAAWAMGICAQVEEAVAGIHARGLVFGDLHLSNVLVRQDGRIALVDYELAMPLEDIDRAALASPGFAAPAGVTGADIDRYAMACLRLALFLPVTELFQIDRVKAVELAEVIRNGFPVSDEFLDDAVRTITGDRAIRHIPAWHSATLPDPARWPVLRRSMARAILDSATPERDDRLFPGDIEQFSTGGLNLAHGAAGVLYALDIVGAGRYPEYETWLSDRAVRPGSRLGFYDGLHGIAHVLARFGHHERALELVEIVAREHWQSLGLGLYGGLSGIGLGLLELSGLLGLADLHTQALKVVDLVASRLESERFPHAGLMHGASGPALLFLRAGEPALAERALRLDLARCRTQNDGSLQVDEGWRTMPYLDRGSVGLAWVLGEHLARHPSAELSSAYQALDLAARSPFYVQSGLFSGRAGVLAYLARHRPSGPLGGGLAGGPGGGLGGGSLGDLGGDLAGGLGGDAAGDRGDGRLVSGPSGGPGGLSGGSSGGLGGGPGGGSGGGPGGGLAGGLGGGAAVGGAVGAAGGLDDDPDVEAQLQALGWHALRHQANLAFPGERLLRLSMDLATGTAGVLLAVGAALHDSPVTLPLMAVPGPETEA
ncbi:class III lanthionine synthetase LanKC [Nonomuraea soli]|uniref:non-specific serine/threonine protein kinase n=1 Tax=Nonomuraea soli TaxID=1032476 RepID=A0A7W0CLL9_9ACTN|nr:class III lanthionine synthetase LanKC [Nonomuraea soli]MBA2893418.1 hypothetical protein [Nonomuraea soli]